MTFAEPCARRGRSGSTSRNSCQSPIPLVPARSARFCRASRMPCASTLGLVARQAIGPVRTPARRSAPRWGALILFLLILYELGANFALRRALLALERPTLRADYGTAYTLVPGKVVIHRLRLERRAEPAYTASLERVELRLALVDFFLARARVTHAEVTGATLVAGRSAPLAPRTASARKKAFSLAAIGASAEREGGLRVESLSGSVLRAEIPGLTVERGMRIELRGLSASAVALELDQASVQLRGAAVLRNGTAVAKAARGELRSRACKVGFAQRERFDCIATLQAELAFALPGLIASRPINVRGRLLASPGGLVHGELTLNAADGVTLEGGGRSWQLPRGFDLRLELSKDGGASGRLSSPELGTSDGVEPRLSLAGLELELASSSEITPESSHGRLGPLRARLRVERALVTHEKRTFRAPLKGSVVLQKARLAPDVWVIRSGSFASSSLSVSGPNVAPEEAPIAAQLSVDSGSISRAHPLSFQGALELSGTEANSLLNLLGLPESVAWMLSRFQGQPFTLRASLRRRAEEARELWLRDLVLTSGQLRIEGEMQLSGAGRGGALLVTIGHSSSGLEFGKDGARVTLTADRAWLSRHLSRSAAP